MELPPSGQREQDVAHPEGKRLDGTSNTALSDAAGTYRADVTPRRDEALEEIWEIRRQISKELGYDPEKKAEYYGRMDKKPGAKSFKK